MESDGAPDREEEVDQQKELLDSDNIPCMPDPTTSFQVRDRKLDSEGDDSHQTYRQHNIISLCADGLGYPSPGDYSQHRLLLHGFPPNSSQFGSFGSNISQS